MLFNEHIIIAITHWYSPVADTTNIAKIKVKFSDVTVTRDINDLNVTID